MSIKGIGGPGAGQPLDGPVRPEEGSGKAVSQAGFREVVAEGPAAARGAEASRDLEAVILRTVEAVRGGSLAPDKALDSILEQSREVLGRSLPRQVDIQETLDYIREILEGDPTFLALLKGSAPGA